MTTTASTPCAATKLRNALEIAIFALGTLVAIGVTVMFIALTGSSRTNSATQQLSSPDAPLVRTAPDPGFRHSEAAPKTPNYERPH